LTPEEHNRYVAWSHLAYGGLMALFCLAMIGMFIGVFGSMPDAPPPIVMLFITIFIGGLYSLMTIPSFVAGYALLKHKSWARTAALIGSVTALTNFPIGAAVCAYTFWFLFSESGKAIFEKRNYMLPPGRQSWAYDVQNNQVQTTYTPPPTPPDWR
jgi:hypothetical protein